MGLSRRKLGRYIRIATGHNSLRYHRSNIDPDIDPMCRFCQEQQESFIHLVQDCPALWKEQQDLAASRGEVEEGQAYDPDHLLQFSFQDRIQKALSNKEDVNMSEDELPDVSMEDLDRQTSESGSEAVSSDDDQHHQQHRDADNQ